LLFGCQVGIMHTNYLDYARREEGGETKAKLLEAYNNWVCRVHCHKVLYVSLGFSSTSSTVLQLLLDSCAGAQAFEWTVQAHSAMTRPVWCLQIVKLSDAVQPLPRQTTQFVHGVPESFLAVGQAKAQPLEDGKPRFTRGAYFMGKVHASELLAAVQRCYSA
jgi:digalactosyldiacylglycerol synthase